MGMAYLIEIWIVEHVLHAVGRQSRRREHFTLPLFARTSILASQGVFDVRHYLKGEKKDSIFLV